MTTLKVVAFLQMKVAGNYHSDLLYLYHGDLMLPAGKLASSSSKSIIVLIILRTYHKIGLQKAMGYKISEVVQGLDFNND